MKMSPVQHGWLSIDPVRLGSLLLMPVEVTPSNNTQIATRIPRGKTSRFSQQA
jgi:hypothetical protein